VSKTLAQNKHVSITIFAFDKDEEISTHESDGDAMVNVLEGKGKFVIDGNEYIVSAGESIIMPSRKPHSVYAIEQFKMMLVVVFPS
jgi:cupin domain protein